jgi:hypothetical protein
MLRLDDIRKAKVQSGQIALIPSNERKLVGKEMTVKQVEIAKFKRTNLLSE